MRAPRPWPDPPLFKLGYRQAQDDAAEIVQRMDRAIRGFIAREPPGWSQAEIDAEAARIGVGGAGA